MVGEIRKARLELNEFQFCYLGYIVRWALGNRYAPVSHTDLEKLLDCISSCWHLPTFVYVVGHNAVPPLSSKEK